MRGEKLCVVLPPERKAKTQIALTHLSYAEVQRLSGQEATGSYGNKGTSGIRLGFGSTDIRGE